MPPVGNPPTAAPTGGLHGTSIVRARRFVGGSLGLSVFIDSDQGGDSGHLWVRHGVLLQTARRASVGELNRTFIILSYMSGYVFSMVAAERMRLRLALVARRHRTGGNQGGD